MAIATLCVIERALAGLNIGQGETSIQPVRDQLQRLVYQAPRLRCLAFDQSVPSLLQCKPVANIGQRCLPLVGAVLSCGLGQELFRFGQSLLLLADNTKPPNASASSGRVFNRDSKACSAV